MSNWKLDLENKAKQLNIERSEDNVYIRSDSGSSSGSSSGRISSIRIPKRNRKTTELNNVTEKGGKGMITVEGALKDLETIEKESVDVNTKAIVKAIKVVVKFLSTMRTNQLLTDAEKVAIAQVRRERQAKEVKK